MEPGDRKQFGTLIHAMAATFGVEPSAPMLEGYWIALKSLALADVQAAVEKALGTCERMPVPAKLRELSGNSGQLAAIDAWTAVIGAIRAHGSYHSVDFGPVVNATVRALGGWRRLCMSDSDQLHNFTRKEFEKIFAAMSTRPAEQLQGDYLRGLHDEPPRRVQVGPAGKPSKQLNGVNRKQLPAGDHE